MFNSKNIKILEKEISHLKARLENLLQERYKDLEKTNKHLRELESFKEEATTSFILHKTIFEKLGINVVDEKVFTNSLLSEEEKEEWELILIPSVKYFGPFSYHRFYCKMEKKNKK